MYRASVDSRMKCYDSPGNGSQNKLKSALKKLFCDICETLISYRHTLEISGTIGITIDSESVLLLQFSEAFHNSKPATPVFRDDDYDDDNASSSKVSITITGSDSKVLKETCWAMTSPPSSSSREQKDRQSTVCRNSLSTSDQQTENVSKNSSGSNLANSSDSNDCLASFGHFDTRPPPSNGLPNSKIETPVEFARNSSCDATEAKPARRSNSMLSQLLQRPPSNAEVYGGVLNHVWPAPVSASEMLKKMSNRVDTEQDSLLGPEAKTSSRIKSDSVCCPSFTQGKTSSYLKELLFKKASGQRSGAQKGISDRKRKRTRPESEMFFVENGREENGQCSDPFSPQLFQFAPINNGDSVSFPQSQGVFFSENRKGGSPNSSSEFSEYRYSMLLHKLVDVRRSQQMDSAIGCNSLLTSGIDSGSGQEQSFVALDQGSRFDPEPLTRPPSLWPQGVKTEIADAELTENSGLLVKFDTGSNSNHANEMNQDLDAC